MNLVASHALQPIVLTPPIDSRLQSMRTITPSNEHVLLLLTRGQYQAHLELAEHASSLNRSQLATMLLLSLLLLPCKTCLRPVHCSGSSQLRPSLVLCRCQGLLRQAKSEALPHSSFASCKASDASAFATKLATAKLDGGTPDSRASLSRQARTASAPLQGMLRLQIELEDCLFHLFYALTLIGPPALQFSWPICTYINKREPLALLVRAKAALSPSSSCLPSYLLGSDQCLLRWQAAYRCLCYPHPPEPASKHSASSQSNSCAS